MILSVMLAKMPTSGGSSASLTFASTILCCFLSLTIWTVAVVGLHHVRNNQDAITATPSKAAANSDLWIPKEDPAAVVPPLDPQPQEAQQPQQEDSPSTTTTKWSVQSSFRLDLSTEDNYQAIGTKLGDQPELCDGPFAEIRSDLDYNFHKVYTCERRQFQDSLIESMLGSTISSTTTSTTTANPQSVEEDSNFQSAEEEPQQPEAGEEGARACTAPHPKRNWIVFTAGVMGAGKSYTMKQLHERGLFPLDDFVTVDPDSVRRHLPEFDLYVHNVPEKAGYHTRKEAGLISEILTEAALQKGRNVLVDGTLRNSTWYQEYFTSLKQRYPQLQIGILHVTAPRQAVLERAMSRAKVTGRVVPRDLLERTMVEVPKSIKILSQQVDFAVELRNPPNSDRVEIGTKGITWDTFQKVWKNQCCCGATTTTTSSTTAATNLPPTAAEADNVSSPSPKKVDYFASIFRKNARHRSQKLLTPATATVAAAVG